MLIINLNSVNLHQYNNIIRTSLAVIHIFNKFILQYFVTIIHSVVIIQSCSFPFLLKPFIGSLNFFRKGYSDITSYLKWFDCHV